METAYDRYCKLKEEYGYNDSYVATEAGITKSTLSDWKKGLYIPKSDKMKKIADVFHVDMEYLISGIKNDPSFYYLKEETAKIANELFQNEELKALFDASRDMSKEDLEAIYQMVLALKRKEKDEKE